MFDVMRGQLGDVKERATTTSVAETAHRLRVTSAHVHLLVRRGDLELTMADNGLFEVTADSLRTYLERPWRR